MATAEMHKPQRDSDRYDATVDNVRFVVHRKRAAGWSMHQPPQDQYILAMATAGRAVYFLEGKSMEVEAGTLMLFGPGQERSAMSDEADPWSFYSTSFSLRPRNESTARAIAELPTARPLYAPSEAETLFEELAHTWTSAGPGHQMICYSLVLRLLYLCVRSHTDTQRPIPHRRRLENVVQLLHRRSEEPFRVAELAEMAGLSESRFRVLFKHLTGLSVVQYQTRIRINKARGLLLSGEYTVTRVAELVGFRDVYYFSRVFKQFTGINPSSLRGD